jgi:hypothetical protein
VLANAVALIVGEYNPLSERRERSRSLGLKRKRFAGCVILFLTLTMMDNYIYSIPTFRNNIVTERQIFLAYQLF